MPSSMDILMQMDVYIVVHWHITVKEVGIWETTNTFYPIQMGGR